jgi:type I pantothenate kinase
MRALLARWPNHTKVDLVATDGFLHPRRVLEERAILHRKGFPESYDLHALISFVSEIKAGRPELAVPIYSHLTYDILPDQFQVVRQPDVLIVEGLNILQAVDRTARPSQHLFASDFFDFTIYVDADMRDIRQWYVERFFALRKTAFQDPRSYFHRYADLSNEEAEAVATRIWRETNEPNLLENILPTRDRAHLILRKGPDHAVQQVRLRKL